MERWKWKVRQVSTRGPTVRRGKGENEGKEGTSGRRRRKRRRWRRKRREEKEKKVPYSEGSYPRIEEGKSPLVRSVNRLTSYATVEITVETLHDSLCYS